MHAGDSARILGFSGALHALLVGKLRIPQYPISNFPSPLKKLWVVSLCFLQLALYGISVLGGLAIWGWARWQGLDDPLANYPFLSLVLEGWCLVGPFFGGVIFHVGRQWAIGPAIEWGMMGVRLGLLVFVILFVSYLFKYLTNDVTISLLTGLCLVGPAPLFGRLGYAAIRRILALKPEDFRIGRMRHHLLEENLIFLSYRRSDSKVWTDRISDELKECFGPRAVFQDVEAIRPGVDFQRHLIAQLDQCQVLLAVIGPDWLTSQDEHGNRRIDRPRDLVRLEIESALRRKIPIIPLLVDNASMPSQDQLPESIRELAFQNCLPIRGNPDFRADMEHLGQAVISYVSDKIN